MEVEVNYHRVKQKGTEQQPGSDVREIVEFRETHQGATKYADEDADYEDRPYRVVLRYNKSYLKSSKGIFRVIEVILSLGALVCVLTAGRELGSYQHLPLSWHHRVFVSVSVVGMMTSLILLVAHVTALVHLVSRLNCDGLEMMINGFLAFIFLFGASLVASTIDYYNNMKQQLVAKETKHKLIAAVVLGYLCMLLYAASGLMFLRLWKKKCKETEYYGKRKQSQQETLVI